MADHDYFDNLLNTMPDAYQALDRLGLYGDFFSFYLCDAILKVNGKGGQPVYIKVVGQAIGEVHAEMKSFSERNLVLIGAIGCALTAAVVLAALNYNKLPFFNQNKHYSAYFAEAGGLIPLAAVQVSGFSVGKVDSLALDGPRVLVTFNVDRRHPARRPHRGGDQDEKPAGRKDSGDHPTR